MTVRAVFSSPGHAGWDLREWETVTSCRGDAAPTANPTATNSKGPAAQVLVRAASRNPTISEYSTDRKYAVRVGRRMMEFHNTNALVGNPTWKIMVQKTGYIEEAGRCLVMQTVIEGRTIVIVLLNSFGKQTRVADAARIRRWMEAKLVESAAAVAKKT